MGLLDKLKTKLDQSTFPTPSGGASGAQAQGAGSAPLSADDIPRYRRQMGINLGSWFVLERWIAPGPFRNAADPGQCDLDIAKGRDAKQVLEEHWDSWIKGEDWDWIVGRGFNSVRLPIGYYHLASVCPAALEGTEFEPYREVYMGAWTRILRVIDEAAKRGLGILIDLHSAAGGQNGDAHSGTNGPPRLFDSKKNLDSAAAALSYLATTLAANPYAVGLELLNEPANNPKLEGWYTSTIASLRSVVGPDFPIYIHDAWITAHYAEWVGKRDDFVVLDHHLYRCFTDADQVLTGEQHAAKLRSGESAPMADWSANAKGTMVVAEWSACLNPRGFEGMPAGEQDRQRRVFVEAELDTFGECTAGWWWWTYKAGEGWTADWDARDASQAEILPASFKRSFEGPPPDHVKEEQLTKADNAHIAYWKAHGGSPNPAVFAPGFSVGWGDALLFASDKNEPDEIGFISQWASRRKREYEAAQGPLGKAAWEWEHGFEQGVKACEAACPS